MACTLLAARTAATQPTVAGPQPSGSPADIAGAVLLPWAIVTKASEPDLEGIANKSYSGAVTLKLLKKSDLDLVLAGAVSEPKSTEHEKAAWENVKKWAVLNRYIDCQPVESQLWVRFTIQGDVFSPKIKFEYSEQSADSHEPTLFIKGARALRQKAVDFYPTIPQSYRTTTTVRLALTVSAQTLELLNAKVVAIEPPSVYGDLFSQAAVKTAKMAQFGFDGKQSHLTKPLEGCFSIAFRR